MKPADLVTPQLIQHCSNFNTIVVLGYTKTGKLPIARKIAQELDCPLFISDEYLESKDPLESFMSDITYHQRSGNQIVVEGTLCFRLLRKGLELSNFNTDLIIKTKCNDETIKYFYNQDGESHKIKRALSFNQGLNKIWDEYKSMLLNGYSPIIPQHIELNTTLPEFSRFL
jgi:hypothetical protein